jgi:hypothetical protein
MQGQEIVAKQPQPTTKPLLVPQGLPIPSIPKSQLVLLEQALIKSDSMGNHAQPSLMHTDIILITTQALINHSHRLIHDTFQFPVCQPTLTTHSTPMSQHQPYLFHQRYKPFAVPPTSIGYLSILPVSCSPTES